MSEVGAAGCSWRRASAASVRRRVHEPPAAAVDGEPEASGGLGDSSPRGRVPGLDALRGLAIALMVLDHAVVALYGPYGLPWVRLSVTRLALPLFMVVAGCLWRSGWRRRYVEVLAAGMLASIAGIGLLEVPNVLVVFLLVVPVLALPRPWLLVAAVVGWVQSTSVPFVALFDPWWWGYEPGTVLLWLAVGRLAHVQVLDVAARVPAVGWLQLLGRFPLTSYVASTVLLVPLVWR